MQKRRSVAVSRSLATATISRSGCETVHVIAMIPSMLTNEVPRRVSLAVVRYHTNASPPDPLRAEHFCFEVMRGLATGGIRPQLWIVVDRARRSGLGVHRHQGDGVEQCHERIDLRRARGLLGDHDGIAFGLDLGVAHGP